MAGLDGRRVAEVVGSIPAGRWMSYADVAHAAGGTSRQARTLNQHFMRHRVAGAHRVLMANGSISANALGDPHAVRRQLEAEGIPFQRERAPQQLPLRLPLTGDLSK